MAPRPASRLLPEYGRQRRQADRPAAPCSRGTARGFQEPRASRAGQVWSPPGVQTFIGGKRHDRGPKTNGRLSCAQGHHELRFMKACQLPIDAAAARGDALTFISLLRKFPWPRA